MFISCLLTCITSFLTFSLEKQYFRLSLIALDLSVINPDWTMDVVSKYGPKLIRIIYVFAYEIDWLITMIEQIKLNLKLQ